MEDVFGPLLGRVLRSRSKVKVPGSKMAFFGPFGGCMWFMFGKTFLAFRFCLCMKYLGEPLNGFAQNSQGRRVLSLARMSLKVKVKVQGHQGQR